LLLLLLLLLLLHSKSLDLNISREMSVVPV
jgi:hypothetical protein